MKWLRLIFIFILLMNAFYISCTYADQTETRSYPNYLIIMVTGINSTQYIFEGEGENGSDLSDFPSYMKKYEFGDLKGYLENETICY